MTNFLPGLELSRRFYHDVARNIVERELGEAPYAAALIGTGSDVLGYDTTRSTDHEWGPRLVLILPAERLAEFATSLHERLRHELPRTFLGYSVHFGPTAEDGVRVMAEHDAGPVEHKIEIRSPESLLDWLLGKRSVERLEPVDWLLMSEQALLELTAGDVFHDGFGELTAIRERLRYYPDAVWRYLLAAQWMRISQVEPFVGRTGEVGDELGSALIGATLARDVMRLAFLIERRYAPYPKWFGSAFARLPLAESLSPLLHRVVVARSWPEREAALAAAYSVLAEAHNRLAITPPLPTEPSAFHNRPFQVIHGERFAEAIRAGIRDNAVRRLPPNVGSVDQWIDSTDVLAKPALRQRLRELYA